MDYYNAYSYRPAAPYMPSSMPATPEQVMMYENLQAAIKLIKDAILGEREDELFYDYLISEAPSEEDKKIIQSIRDDERKHNKMFKELYYELTGKMPPSAPEPEFVKPESYSAGLQQALFGELGAVERYRKILFGLTKRKDINMITEIITDELKHASKYNFLYAKNKIK
ncbi:MAG: ferritin-like domain-containing protein [Deltaproteobacteria bacterium]